jgi:hypothetical protein
MVSSTSPNSPATIAASVTGARILIGPLRTMRTPITTSSAIEPIYMFMLIGLALVWRSRSHRKGFLAIASIALALMAIRRLGNATVAWTDLDGLRTYAWLA